MNIKGMLVASALSLISGPALAQSASVVQEFCAGIEGLAESIMLRRQQGASFSDTLEIAQSFGEENPMTALAVQLTVEAYGRPRYTTDKVKLEEIQDFANYAGTECWVGFTE